MTRAVVAPAAADTGRPRARSRAGRFGRQIVRAVLTAIERIVRAVPAAAGRVAGRVTQVVPPKLERAVRAAPAAGRVARAVLAVAGRMGWPVRARRQGRSSDDGMATAELAVSLPVLMILIVAAVYAVQVVGMRVRCLDAAREAARAAARGDPHAASLGRGVLPGARVAVRQGSATVTAVVTIHLRPLGAGLPAVTITEQVTAQAEPDSAGGSP